MAFNPSRFSFSCAKFFELSQSELSDLFRLPRMAKRHAFFGDSILQFECVKYLQSKYASASLGELSLRKIALVQNATLASLFDGVFSRDLVSEGTRLWSAHKKGTIVEAAIQLSYQRSPETAQRCVRDMLEWVDEHVKPDMVLSALPDGDAVDSFTAALAVSPPLTAAQDRLLTQLAEVLSHVQPGAVVLYDSDEPPHRRPRLDAARPHLGGTEEIEWTSGSGQKRFANFYKCCGEQEHYASESCPNNPTSYFHPGHLFLHSSRSQPGGVAPTGTCLDHVPRVREPSWTCCKQLATTKGCEPLNDD